MTSELCFSLWRQGPPVWKLPLTADGLFFPGRADEVKLTFSEPALQQQRQQQPPQRVAGLDITAIAPHPLLGLCTFQTHRPRISTGAGLRADDSDSDSDCDEDRFLIKYRHWPPPIHVIPQSRGLAYFRQVLRNADDTGGFVFFPNTRLPDRDNADLCFYVLAIRPYRMVRIDQRLHSSNLADRDFGKQQRRQRKRLRRSPPSAASQTANEPNIYIDPNDPAVFYAGKPRSIQRRLAALHRACVESHETCCCDPQDWLSLSALWQWQRLFPMQGGVAVDPASTDTVDAGSERHIVFAVPWRALQNLGLIQVGREAALMQTIFARFGLPSLEQLSTVRAERRKDASNRSRPRQSFRSPDAAKTRFVVDDLVSLFFPPLHPDAHAATVDQVATALNGGYAKHMTQMIDEATVKLDLERIHNPEGRQGIHDGGTWAHRLVPVFMLPFLFDTCLPSFWGSRSRHQLVNVCYRIADRLNLVTHATSQYAPDDIDAAMFDRCLLLQAMQLVWPHTLQLQQHDVRVDQLRSDTRNELQAVRRAFQVLKDAQQALVQSQKRVLAKLDLD